MKYRTLIIFLIALPFTLSGQDIHYSNNGIISTFFNPANTGAFQGNIRASAVYRDQFNSFIANPYKTTSLSVDSPIAYGLKDNHWVGVGIQMYTDKAGDVELRRTGYGLGAAYHVGLDKNFRSVITLGFSYVNISGGIDDSNARSTDREDFSGIDFSQSSIGVGLKLKTEVGKNSFFETGVAMQKLTASSTTNTPDDNTLETRFNVSMLLNSRLSKTIRLTPEFYFSKSRNSTNMSLHIFPEFALGKQKQLSLRPGLGMRFGDAMIMHLGGLYKGWRVNLSYDLTVSSASTYNGGNGGFEIGIQRIFIIHKKPKTKLKLICPRL